MRARAALVTIFCAAVLSACGAKSATEADPCELFTAQEVAAFTGNPIERRLPTGTGEGCKYAPASTDGTSLLLTLGQHETAQKFASTKEVSEKSGGVVQPLADIGDEAFAYSPSDTQLQSAESRIAERRVRVLLQGPQATEANAVSALREAVRRLPQ